MGGDRWLRSLRAGKLVSSIVDCWTVGRRRAGSRHLSGPFVAHRWDCRRQVGPRTMIMQPKGCVPVLAKGWGEMKGWRGSGRQVEFAPKSMLCYWAAVAFCWIESSWSTGRESRQVPEGRCLSMTGNQAEVTQMQVGIQPRMMGATTVSTAGCRWLVPRRRRELKTLEAIEADWIGNQEGRPGRVGEEVAKAKLKRMAAPTAKKLAQGSRGPPVARVADQRRAKRAWDGVARLTGQTLTTQTDSRSLALRIIGPCQGSGQAARWMAFAAAAAAAAAEKAPQGQGRPTSRFTD